MPIPHGETRCVSSPPRKDDSGSGAMTDAEQEARERLAQCARIFGRLNLLNVGGHVSLRVPESDLILITPGGALDKTRLTADDMVTMDEEGVRVAGRWPTPRETAIHVAIHARRPE